MNFSQETIDKKFSLPKTANKTIIPETQSVVSQKQSVFYTSKQQTKLNFKR